MKKILVAALLLSAPAFAMAQKPDKSDKRRAPLTAEQRAEKQTARLDKMVQLSPEQRQKIQAENLRTAKAMQPHMDNIRKERMAMREIGKRRHEAYSSILTTEQMERLKAERKERRRAIGERGRKPATRHDKVIEMESAPAPKQ